MRVIIADHRVVIIKLPFDAGRDLRAVSSNGRYARLYRDAFRNLTDLQMGLNTPDLRAFQSQVVGYKGLKARRFRSPRR